MYQSFSAKNFRCFEDLTIDDLKRINLIVGKNNVGKSALLEALFIYFGAYKSELVLQVNALRGIGTFRWEQGSWAKTPWDSIFHDFDNTKTVQLVGHGTKVDDDRSLWLRIIRDTDKIKEIGLPLQTELPSSNGDAFLPGEITQILELEFKQGNQAGKNHTFLSSKGPQSEAVIPSIPHPTFLVSTRTQAHPAIDAERYSGIDLSAKPMLINALRIVEPNLINIEVRFFQGTAMIHGEITGRKQPLPLYLMGEGIARLASFLLAIGNASGGVVLIDEIENGFHHSVLPDIWRAIEKVAHHFNVQIFATSHSFECIRAAHLTFENDPDYDFKLIRLERDENLIRARGYDKEALDAAIDVGLEVR